MPGLLGCRFPGRCFRPAALLPGEFRLGQLAVPGTQPIAFRTRSAIPLWCRLGCHNHQKSGDKKEWKTSFSGHLGFLVLLWLAGAG